MIGILVRILFFGCFLLGPIAKASIIGIGIHLYRKSARDEKMHPEKYKNKKPDTFCYWID